MTHFCKIGKIVIDGQHRNLIIGSEKDSNEGLNIKNNEIYEKILHSTQFHKSRPGFTFQIIKKLKCNESCFKTLHEQVDDGLPPVAV